MLIHHHAEKSQEQLRILQVYSYTNLELEQEDDITLSALLLPTEIKKKAAHTLAPQLHMCPQQANHCHTVSLQSTMCELTILTTTSVTITSFIINWWSVK